MRHLIAIVELGPLAGKKLAIAPGSSLTIGRDDAVEISLLRDGSVSRLHCRISWDGERGTAEDLDSTSGTLLGGQPLEGSAPIGHGGWLQIGETTVTTWVEGHTEPRHPQPPDSAREGAAARALDQLQGVRSLYGVFDAARDERILELLRESVDAHENLYSGVQGRALADVAPHLVRFEPGSKLLPKLVGEGWGNAWGVYLASDETFKEVRRHLRRFLVIHEEPSRRRLYFRWYDPRVLRDFMAIVSARQAGELFGARTQDAATGAPAAFVLRAMFYEEESLETVRVGAPGATIAFDRRVLGAPEHAEVRRVPGP